jgi:Kae1-associated kinase Bud32
MSKENFFKQGAEAVLTEENIDGEKVLVKKRVKKNYRNEKLDFEIRKKRTRGEAKLLKEASSAVKTPRVMSVDENTSRIVMEFIEGKRLKDAIKKNSLLCTQAGKEIRKLHDAGIIHGDLTTSNIIFSKKDNKLYFIDFGLGYFSDKLEDKATDLVVFKKTFNATHSSIKNGWEKVMEGYAPQKEMEERMVAIEKRARYH